MIMVRFMILPDAAFARCSNNTFSRLLSVWLSQPDFIFPAFLSFPWGTSALRFAPFLSFPRECCPASRTKLSRGAPSGPLRTLGFPRPSRRSLRRLRSSAPLRIFRSIGKPGPPAAPGSSTALAPPGRSGTLLRSSFSIVSVPSQAHSWRCDPRSCTPPLPQLQLRKEPSPPPSPVPSPSPGLPAALPGLLTLPRSHHSDEPQRRYLLISDVIKSCSSSSPWPPLQLHTCSNSPVNPLRMTYFPTAGQGCTRYHTLRNHRHSSNTPQTHLRRTKDERTRMNNQPGSDERRTLSDQLQNIDT